MVYGHTSLVGSLIPYVIFEFVYLIGLHIAAMVGLPTTNTTDGNLWTIPRTILLHPIGGYWFLHALVVLQIMLLLCNRFFNSSRLISAVVFLTLAGILTKLGLIKSYAPAYFFTGYVLALVFGRDIEFPRPKQTLLATLSCLLLILLADPLPSEGILQFAWCLGILAVFYLIAELFEKNACGKPHLLGREKLPDHPGGSCLFPGYT